MRELERQLTLIKQQQQQADEEKFGSERELQRTNMRLGLARRLVRALANEEVRPLRPLRPLPLRSLQPRHAPGPCAPPQAHPSWVAGRCLGKNLTGTFHLSRVGRINQTSFILGRVISDSWNRNVLGAERDWTEGQVRWGAGVETLASKLHTCVGDTLVATTFVAYAGVFSKPYRSELLHERCASRTSRS